jgi:hypothetical protein
MTIEYINEDHGPLVSINRVNGVSDHAGFGSGADMFRHEAALDEFTGVAAVETAPGSPIGRAAVLASVGIGAAIGLALRKGGK